jgi:transposase, IS30 family
MRRSLTIDNGTDFAYDYRLNREFGMAPCFRDPHSPWQKGGIENAIG